MAISLPIKPLEPFHTFVSRYAYHRGVRLDEYSLHTGVQVAYPRPRDIAKIAKDTQNTAVTLAFHTSPAPSQRYRRVFNETVVGPDLEKVVGRFCPRCVYNDYASEARKPFGEIYCRAHWEFRCISTCVEHALDLVEISNPYPSRYCTDFTQRISKEWNRVVDLNATARAVPVSGFDRYFTGRLGGQRVAVDLLDGLPFHGAVRLCEIVGALVLDQKASGVHKLPTTERVLIARHGFETLSGGYQAFEKFLTSRDKMQFDMNDGPRVRPWPRNCYGHLHTYVLSLRGKPEFKTLVDFMEAHICRVADEASEQITLGDLPVKSRYSISSAASEYCLDPEIVRSRLVEAKLLAPETGVRDRKILVSPNVIDDIMAKHDDVIPLTRVAAILSIQWSTMQRFVEQKLIQLVRPECYGRHKGLTSASGLKALVENIRRKTSITTSVRGMARITQFGNGLDAARIIALALEGAVTLHTLDNGPTRLANLWAMRSEVHAAAKINNVTRAVSFRAAAKRLMIPHHIVPKLIDQALLRTGGYPLKNGTLAVGCTVASIDKFAKIYISYAEISATRTVPENFAQIGPHLRFGASGGIYRRADLAQTSNTKLRKDNGRFS